MLTTMRGTAQLLAFLSLAVVGCTGVDRKFDFDGDGFDDSEDCAPEDPSTHPGADDPYGDDLDANCDGLDGLDADGDGYPGNEDLSDQPDLWDCNDADSDTYPGAEDVPDDGIDQDCDGLDLVDADDDGHPDGVTDCDDSDATVYLDAPELPDGKDNDCDGSIDEGTELADDDGDGSCEGFDLDGDAVDECSDGSEPGDCDDGDPALNLSDIDVDGQDTCGGDCDDFNQDVFSGAAEVCNGEDDDCDGSVSAGELDVDLDGYAICEGDCEDSNPAVHPGDTDADGFTLCDPTPDCDDEDAALTPEDADLDQYSSCTGDCDDADPFIYLGAVERCNALDDDCDGAVPAAEVDGDGDSWLACQDCDDGDALLFGLDEDGDGLSMCVGDCDDSNAAVYPGAFDGWGNGLDEDCSGEDGIDWDGDGAAANATPPGLGTPEWDCDDFDASANRLDSDADGVDTCAPTPDCDDGNTGNYPGNTDDECDGVDTNCIPDPLEVDNDGDGWMECEGDCDDFDPLMWPQDQDGDGWTLCSGDCDDLDPTRFPGNWADAWTSGWADALDANCDGVDGYSVLGADATWYGEAASNYSGYFVLVAGDVDGDGIDDLLSTSWANDTGGTNVGKSYLISGANSDLVEEESVATADWSFVGETAEERAAFLARTPCDIDGDGLSEVVVGAPFRDSAGTSSGRLSIVLGSTLPSLPTTSSIANADYSWDGVAGEMLGLASPACADLDGDGLDDILVPSSRIVTTTSLPSVAASTPEGRVFLLLGASIVAGNITTLEDADAVFAGEAFNDRFGTSIDTGDFDADSIPDILVGAPLADVAGSNSGKAYLFSGSEVLAALASAGGQVTLETTQAEVCFTGEGLNDYAGEWVGFIDDLDGDSLDEVLLAAPENTGAFTSAGKSYLYFGSSLNPGTLGLAGADASFVGTAPSDRSQPVSAQGGDFDADGLVDLVFGSNSNGAYAGRVWVYLGATIVAGGPFDLASADATFFGALAGDGVGWAVSVGDVDGDGTDDLLLGANNGSGQGTGSHSGPPDAGATYLIRGPN